jgi:hypothetical protein
MMPGTGVGSATSDQRLIPGQFSINMQRTGVLMLKIKCATLLALSVLSSPVNAEDLSYFLNSTPGQRAEAQTRFMKNRLGLSAEKLAEVHAINLQFAEKAEPVIKGPDNLFVKIYDIKNLQEQKDDLLSHVFSKQQFQLYSDLKDELKAAVKADLTR